MAGGIFSDPQCARAGCGRPTVDAYLCRTCAHDLRVELEHIIEWPATDARGTPIPGLEHELTTTLQRNDRVGGADVGWITYTPEHPIPYAQHASDAIATLRTVLSTWIRELWETNGGDAMGEFRCEDTLAGMADWLLLRPSWMSLHTAAGELYLDITQAIATAWRAVDRAPANVYSGICGATTDDGDCGQPLYSPPDHTWVRCRTCGSVWDVHERRQWLLGYAEQTPLTATRMAGLLAHAGITITAAQIRCYSARGRIEVVDRDQRGHPLYRISDVRKAIADRYKRRPDEHTARLLAAQ